jgi:hypothetical protein
MVLQRDQTQELMQSNAAQMAMYGIVIGIPQLILTLLANIETATKSNYGHEYCLAMMPSAMSKHTITCMMRLHSRSFSRSWRVLMACGYLKDAPAQGTGTGTARVVAKSVSYLQAMMDGDTDSTYIKFGVWHIPTATRPKKKTNHEDAITRNPNIPSCTANAENSKRTRTTSQRKIRAPTARRSIPRSLIRSNRTSARGTRNIRATTSN